MDTIELMGLEERNKYWKMGRKLAAYIEIISTSKDAAEVKIVTKGLYKILDECLEDEWLDDLTKIYRYSKNGKEYNIVAVYSFVDHFVKRFPAPDDISKETEEEPKPNGINKSIYIKPDNMSHYEALCKLAKESGTSFSELMNEAIRQAYYQKRTRTWISPGAYLAIANGQLEVLECQRSRDDGMDLHLKIDAPKYVFDDTEPDSTFKEIDKGTAYAVGGGILRECQKTWDK